MSTAKPQLLVVKLGGSLITDKQTPFTARPEVIAELAAELRQFREQFPHVPVLLGNGAGSFGHVPAHQYGLRNGAHTPEQFYGMAVTHTAVQQLNIMITNELTKQGLAAFSLAPSAIFTCNNGEIAAFEKRPLLHLLKNGCIPVLYGDTLCDTTRGTTICSTERALDICAQVLAPAYDLTVVYVMRASGVLDLAGKVLPSLPPDHVVTILQSDDHDVTGGIEGKIAAARRAAQYARRVYITGVQSEMFACTLRGEQIGTQICLT